MIDRSSTDIVSEGDYIVRFADNDVVIDVSGYRGRTRVPTMSDTESCVRHWLLGASHYDLTMSCVGPRLPRADASA